MEGFKNFLMEYSIDTLLTVRCIFLGGTMHVHDDVCILIMTENT